MRSKLVLALLSLYSAACATTAQPPPSMSAPVAPTPAAPDVDDPCRAAVCPDATRCVSVRSEVYRDGEPTQALLPRCISVAPGPAPTPTRDPCANMICPEGYRCTAPADAPYCDRAE